MATNSSTLTVPIEPAPRSRAFTPLVLAALAGGAVSTALGVYGQVDDPTGRQIINFGFPSLGAMKSWLATCVFALAVAQLISALAMFGRLPGVQRAPEWMPFVHRWSGTTAFVVSLPVAYHCLWSLGFQTVGTRQVVHATAGCLFYGAFAIKLLALRIGRLPGWALPIIGGTIVAALTAIWLTSALWFFTKVGLPAYH